MKIKKYLTIVVSAMMLSSCGNSSQKGVTSPLMNLEWFEDINTVKKSMSGYSLTEERESEQGGISQKFLDYDDTRLFEVPCGLTLCFTESGLAGLNYHDTQKIQNYSQWFENIEKFYGVPTEKGNGLASWYDNPLGKNTAVYLFNLEEGVQISFYATENTPDKSHTKQEKEMPVPSPELRTPVVPYVPENDGLQQNNTTVQTSTTVSVSTESITESPFSSESTAISVSLSESTENLQETPEYIQSDNQSVQTSLSVTTPQSTGTVTVTTTLIQSSSVQTTVKTSTATTAVTDIPETATVTSAVTTQPQNFRRNGLEFYSQPSEARSTMSQYSQTHEYRIEEKGEPWELIMEYQNVNCFDRNCDAVLCFTSLGLVGISYFDYDTENFSYWTEKLSDIYGNPENYQDNCLIWVNSPLGEGTSIYVFSLQDGIQISFFADDTGSEIS